MIFFLFSYFIIKGSATEPFLLVKTNWNGSVYSSKDSGCSWMENCSVYTKDNIHKFKVDTESAMVIFISYWRVNPVVAFCDWLNEEALTSYQTCRHIPFIQWRQNVYYFFYYSVYKKIIYLSRVLNYSYFLPQSTLSVLLSCLWILQWNPRKTIKMNKYVEHMYTHILHSSSSFINLYLVGNIEHISGVEFFRLFLINISI